jgi:hypothetical protein
MINIKRNMKHPNFVLGIISYVLLLAGVVLLTTEITLGRQLIIAAFVAGGVHWIRSIVDVYTDRKLKNQTSRYFWFALIIMVPPLAGMIYYMIDGKNYSY